MNASFNIAVRQISVSRSAVDRDAVEGSTDTPKEATPMSDGDLRTPHASAMGVCQARGASSSLAFRARSETRDLFFVATWRLIYG